MFRTNFSPQCSAEFVVVHIFLRFLVPPLSRNLVRVQQTKFTLDRESWTSKCEQSLILSKICQDMYLPRQWSVWTCQGSPTIQGGTAKAESVQQSRAEAGNCGSLLRWDRSCLQHSHFVKDFVNRRYEINWEKWWLHHTRVYRPYKVAHDLIFWA